MLTVLQLFPSYKSFYQISFYFIFVLTLQPLSDDLMCHICDKTFKSKQSLQAHMSIHTGLLPFACDVLNVRRFACFVVALSLVRNNQYCGL